MDLEALVTQLVQDAPAQRPELITALQHALAAVTAPPHAAALASSISAIVGRLGSRADQVDPGVALPPLAMATSTLVDCLAGRLGAREAEAARYEIDTLTPLPTAPDVSLDRLRRR